VSRTFEYQVCHAQQSAVTFVNGVWQGSVPLDPEHTKEQSLLRSCPTVWEYLQQRDAEGWELVAVTTRMIKKEQGFFAAVLEAEHEETNFDTLYLKRSSA